MQLKLLRAVSLLGIALPVLLVPPLLSLPHSPCRIQSVTFDGWPGQQVENDWLQLTFVPQLGGRLMQVTFNEHPYLFVNPKYKGKYISPADAAGRWINYGGDKIWPLPEGNDDEQHWTGASTALDDGAYSFSILSHAKRCTVRLEGPPDPPTGLQYSREISIGNESPEISFHSTMKNFTGHTIAWSVQSVSQYDLSNPKDKKLYNPDFWAFTPVNPHSSYLLGYHARDGLANDPSYSVKNGLFRLNWKYIESEVWVDSNAGWIALVNGLDKYAMVEKTKYVADGPYPGKASVIFYKNGPVVRMGADGTPRFTSTKPEETPYYMEAELNSPIAILGPGESYSLDTSWFPTRMGPDLQAATDAGLVGEPLTVRETAGKLEISGSFGVFFPGELTAYLYDSHGAPRGKVALQTVKPQDIIQLHRVIVPPTGIGRVSLHLIDENNVDRGSFGEVSVTESNGGR